MARPRVFLSSTFFDLRQVRDDLERFIRTLGYEPVRHETGRVPYAKDERLEMGAYKEVDLCDMLVTVIGGRFGTDSREYPGQSITQTEIKRALDRGIAVFIFVDANVHGEYQTYLLNKGNTGIKYRFVDDQRIFEFLEYIHSLQQNNPIAAFQTAADITTYLLEQWAGLFQRYLQQQQRQTELRVVDELNKTSATLRELVNFLTAERENANDAINNVLLPAHPLFSTLATLTKTDYRIFFLDRAEMETWLRARSWKKLDDFSLDADSTEEWQHEKFGIIKFTVDPFDEDGRLKQFRQHEWKDEYVFLRPPPPPQPRKARAANNAADEFDDDIPF